MTISNIDDNNNIESISGEIVSTFISIVNNIEENLPYNPILFGAFIGNKNDTYLDDIVITFNILQSVPLNCWNRNDFNEVKKAKIANVWHNLVTAQCLNFAVRDRGKACIKWDDPDVHQGIRTKNYPYLLREAGEKEGLIGAQLEEFVDMVGKTFASDTLAFCSRYRLRLLAGLYKKSGGDIKSVVKTTGSGDKKKYFIEEEAKKMLNNLAPLPFDIALYGRMAAMDPSFTVTGALCVATAYSTHQAYIYDDTFVGNDDLNTDSAGAAHMGHAQQSAFVLYRHMQLDLGQLRLNRKNCCIAEDVERLLYLLYSAVPVGKQSRNLSSNPWSYAQISVHRRGTSLQADFEKPVKAAPEGGYLEPSIKELERQLDARRRTSSMLEEFLTVTVGDGHMSIGEASQKICEFIYELEKQEWAEQHPATKGE